MLNNLKIRSMKKILYSLCILCLLTIISFFSSCNSMERFMGQDWIVDEFYLEGVECRNSCLGSNTLYLYKNGAGKAPRLSGQERSHITWSVFKDEKGNYYLSIEDLKIEIFNDDFLIKTNPKENWKIELVGKYVVMKCSSFDYFLR